jgi:hypothetical protein
MKSVQAAPEPGQSVRDIPITARPEPIVIHVAGGGAQVVFKPPGVIVEIHDFDTLSESGELIEEFSADLEIRYGRAVAR